MSGPAFWEGKLSSDTPGAVPLKLKLLGKVSAMEAKRMGRPSKGFGERHTIAVKVTPEQMDKLRELAELLETKPGTYLTELAQQHIDAVHLDEYRHQEALPFHKVS